MDAICGVLGRRDAKAVRAMAAAMKHRGNARHVLEGDSFTVAGSTVSDTALCLVDGSPRDSAGAGVAPAEVLARCQGFKGPAKFDLRGRFAAAVGLDDGARWWLVRDRLGVKPLYYCQGDGFLAFASELKGLLASGLVEKHLDLASVDRYLTLRCVPGPESIVQGVRRVQPGHVLVYEAGGTGDKGLQPLVQPLVLSAREVAYAQCKLQVEPTTRDAAAARLRELLDNAARKTEAEALLWSAGVDCAALAALKPGLRPVFVKLRTAWQDEARLAQWSAKLMGLPLEQRRSYGLTEAAFNKAVYHLDEPIADASVFPLWLIAEQAGQVAPTFLTGHGANELLGGYPRYHFLQKTRGAHRRIPVNLLGSLMPALPPNAFVRRGARYLTSVHDNLEAYLSLLSVFDHDEREELYTDTMKAAMFEKGGSVEVMRPHFVDGDLTRNLLSLDLCVGLPDLLVAGCDRMAAAHGVELEFPYLDDDFVDFLVTLPADVKFGARSKALLRHAMRGVLPGRVRVRSRRGFRVPQAGTVVRVIENVTRETITQERVEASGLFRWPVVQQVVRSSGHNVYRRRQFWALLMFFAWYRAFMET